MREVENARMIPAKKTSPNSPIEKIASRFSRDASKLSKRAAACCSQAGWRARMMPRAKNRIDRNIAPAPRASLETENPNQPFEDSNEGTRNKKTVAIKPSMAAARLRAVNNLNVCCEVDGIKSLGDVPLFFTKVDGEYITGEWCRSALKILNGSNRSHTRHGFFMIFSYN